MADCLLVPIRVKALFLPDIRKEIKPPIPRNGPAQNRKSEGRSVSKEISLQPSPSLEPYQKHGIHLHWFLPFALTRGKVNKEKGIIEFPSVPNRWLITRRDKSGVKKQWVVESDYLHPEGQGEDQVAFPLPAKESTRHIGRNMSLDEWLASAKVDYGFEKLIGRRFTALGYGVPTFATCYSQCYSVFGFHDGEIKNPITDGLKYTVIGWYNEPTDDFLKQYLAQPDLLEGGLKVVDVLERDLNWSLPGDPAREELQRMFCYGAVKPLQYLKTQPQKVAVANSVVGALAQPQKVVVASSGMEALTAYLADEIAREKKIPRALIEEQLDFISVQPKLGEDPLNLDEKFHESLHENGFNPVYGGSRWIIQPNISPLPSSRQSQEKTKVKLSPEMARHLYDLNCEQEKHNRITQERMDIQHQRSSDNWHKYKQGIRSTQDSDQGGKTTTEEILSKIIVGKESLEKIIGQGSHPGEKESYTLKETPAARYWQPKEPVVLIAGVEIPSFVKKQNQGASLTKTAIPEDEDIPTFAEKPISNLGYKIVNISNLDQTVTKPVLEKILVEIAGLPVEDDLQPWPVLLEWELAFFSLRSENGEKGMTSSYSMETGRGDTPRLYPSDFITGNFDFLKKKIDFRRKAVADGPQQQESFGIKGEVAQIPEPEQKYRGSSVLTPQTGNQLKQNIVKHLRILINKERIAARRKRAQGGKPQTTDTKMWYDCLFEAQANEGKKESFEERLVKNLAKIREAYENRPGSVLKAPEQAELPDPFLTFLSAFEILQNATFLIQPLSGFNDQLVHRGTAPLSNIVPAFSSLSAKKDIAGASQIESEFNPIRAGAMKLLSLRLVDTFGMPMEVPCSSVIVGRQMRSPADEQGRITLPPRLAQPARLSFRWLAAAVYQELREMNVDAETQPICGWLLPNFLENSLTVYDDSGNALGRVAAKPNIVWKPAPGSSTMEVGDIANSHLRKVIAHLCNSKNDGAFLDGFIQQVEKSLENIVPIHSDGPVELAQLIGRPIAVVRASLQFEVFGLPAAQREQSAPLPQSERAAQGGHAFGDVRIPVRLGDDKRLSDGLIGYWAEENTQGALAAPFRPSQTFIELAVDDPPKTLTLLLDPHGKVHAACGILPVKAIDIPAEQYADSLQNLGMTFLAAPLLTNQNEIRLPVSADSGQNWTWLDDREGGWKEVSLPSSQGAFAAPQEIWEVWLKLTPDENLSNNNHQDKD